MYIQIPCWKVFHAVAARASVVYCSEHPCGGRNYILKWVFFVQSILADRYIHRREMWVVSLKSASSVQFKIKKIFLIFVFFEDLSRFKVCEHAIFAWFCLTFSKIFVQIKALLLFQNYISHNKLKQFRVANRPIKRLVLVSWRSLLSKKCRIQFESCFFFRKISYLLLFFYSLRD